MIVTMQKLPGLRAGSVQFSSVELTVFYCSTVVETLLTGRVSKYKPAAAFGGGSRVGLE